MKRMFFFLRDSVTKKFYTGQNVHLADFSQAAVYFQKANAEKKIKEMSSPKRAGNWSWYETLSAVGFSASKAEMREVNRRKNLPNWGIEIVEVEVNTPQ
jgi:hypothetical protein